MTKCISLFLVVVLVFCVFSGCSNSDNTTPKTSQDVKTDEDVQELIKQILLGSYVVNEGVTTLVKVCPWLDDVSETCREGFVDLTSRVYLYDNIKDGLIRCKSYSDVSGFLNDDVIKSFDLVLDEYSKLEKTEADK